MTKNPGKAVLEGLYVDQRLTVREIGLRYGVTRTGVRKWLVAEGIPLIPYDGKGKPKSPEHAAKLAENLKKARVNAFTPEALKKRSEAQLGRRAHNKGGTWSAEQRAKHKALNADPEHREKLSASKRGDKNGQWRGGVSPTDKRLKHWSWKEARKACYERDGWTCRDCGVKCHNGVRIQAHHIIPRRHGGR